MLEITCPMCHVTGDETDFTAGPEAYIKRPATQDPHKVSLEDHYHYLYIRTNPKGPRNELWQCTRGCSKWFIVNRDTVSLEILSTTSFKDPLASEEIIKETHTPIPKPKKTTISKKIAIKKTPQTRKKVSPSKTADKNTSSKNHS